MKTIVIDIGSYRVLVGFAGNFEPSFFAYNCTDGEDIGGQKSFNSGSDRVFSIIKGEIVDKSVLFNVVQFALKKIVDLAPDGPLLANYNVIVVTPFSNKLTGLAEDLNFRKEMSEFLFDKLLAESVAFLSAPVCSLVSTGMVSGIVVDVGYSQSRIVPIYEGTIIKSANVVADIGGADIDNALTYNLEEVTAHADILASTVVDVKESLCSCKEIADQNAEKAYKLPDGKVIKIDEPLLTCGYEILFSEGLGCVDLSKLFHKAIMNTPEFMRDILMEYIYPAGGTSQLGNFVNCLESEILKVEYFKAKKLTFAVDSSKNYSAWLGASIIGAISSFDKFRISKQAYKDKGLSDTELPLFTAMS